MNHLCSYMSPLGKIYVACNERSLTGLWFEGQKYFLSTLGEADRLKVPVHDRVFDWLDLYFSGQQPPLSFTIAPKGSDFSLKVWRELIHIPYGSARTYGSIAKAIGCKSAQAVGGAVSRNPISIIIPCHRVIGTSGNLTGYAGGIERKEQLLKLEHII